MKKIFNYFLLISLMIIAMVTNVKAEDVTNNFRIESARACSDATCTTVYDENNGFISQGIDRISIEIKWSYNSNTPIKDGDTITIPFANEKLTAESSSWASGTFAWSNIVDNNGNKIGQWSVTGNTSSRKMNIKFSDSAVGKYSLSGILHTPKSMYSIFNYEDKLIYLTVGDKKLKLLSLTRKMPTAKNDIVCSINSIGNNSVSWSNITLSNTIKELYMYDDYNELTDDAKFDNLIMEYSLSNDATIDESSLSVGPRWVYPTNLTEHYASDTGSSIGKNHYFTKINQEENEDYNSFKSRINEMQYGIYIESETSKPTLVINFGSQPSKNYTFQNYIDDLSPNLTLAQFANRDNPYSVTMEAANIIERALGTNNIIGGKIPLWKSTTIINYPTAVVDDTIKEGVFKVSYTDTNGEYKEIQKKCIASLKVPSSTALINKGEVKLTLIDSKSKNIIVGTNFSLQKNSNGNWENYRTNLVTDENGTIIVPGLSSGVYRFVQESYLNHYVNNSFKLFSNQDLSNEILSFEINSDDENGLNLFGINDREKYTITYKPGEHGAFEDKTYNVYYGDSLPIYTPQSNNGWNFIGWNPELPLSVVSDGTYTAQWEKKVKLKVHYYISGTTTKVSDDITSIVRTGDNYTTNRSSDVADKYEFVGISGEESGLVGENDIEVTYYYQLKPAILTVNYIEENTGTVLATKVEQNLHYDDMYNTTESDEIKNNYTLKRIEGVPSGIVSSDEIVVTYYYEKKDSKLDINLSKSGSNEITGKDSVLNYKIKCEINVEDYIGDGNITIIDTLPFEIDEGNSNLDGGVYNKDNKTIVWKDEWKDIDSYSLENKIFEKNIKIKYNNLDSTKRIMTNNAKAIVELDNNTKEIATRYDTDVKIPSKIIVKYIDEETGDNLIDQIISESLVADDYSLETKEFEGYDLIEKPDSEVVKYLDEEQSFVYKYKKKLLNISTSVLGQGGNITGDEPVKYGENSTANKIKIKADDNYFIGKVLINGVEQRIKSNIKNLTLSNFKNVKENIEIVVIFNRELDNPKTGNNYLFYVVGGILIISITTVLILVERKRNNIKVNL